MSCLRLFRRQNKGALSLKCSCVEKSTLQAPAPKFEGGHTSYGRSVLRIASVGPVSGEYRYLEIVTRFVLWTLFAVGT